MLTVMTLNIWGNNQWDERRPAIAEWIAELQPDLVALQEVWSIDGDCQADQVAAEVGMTASFGASFTRGERQFGNAVLSRMPVLSDRFLPLPMGEGHREPRGMLSVEVQTEGGPMWFSSTHLSHLPAEGWVREQQAVAIAESIDDLPSVVPAVLCGDMNSTFNTPELQFLKGLASLDGRRGHFVDAYEAANPHDLGATWSHTNPNVGGSFKRDRRIDFILVDAPRPDQADRVLSSSLVCDQPRGGVWPSDHFGVLATFSVP
jgi:endonuclease/exonuclease/phosphatase family metal-dependent hydrolase